jgi:hypothetical protein
MVTTQAKNATLLDLEAKFNLQLFNPGNDLYSILRILKRLGQLMQGV